MHWVISGSFGPTDPTRAMLPFLFAASAVQIRIPITGQPCGELIGRVQQPGIAGLG